MYDKPKIEGKIIKSIDRYPHWWSTHKHNLTIEFTDGSKLELLVNGIGQLEVDYFERTLRNE